MKTVLKYLSMTIFTIGLFFLCFILPAEFSSYRDAKTVGEINLETLEETNVVLPKQMTMLEKLNLLSSKDMNTNGISIRQGKDLTEEEVKKACKAETDKLKEVGILGDININFDKDYKNSQINFYISAEDPSKSMIVWNAFYIQDDNIIIISLDDETGKIIGFGTNNYSIFYPDGGNYQSMVKELGNYLGLDTVKIGSIYYTGAGDSTSIYKNMGLTVLFSDDKQQMESEVYMFKTGFSFGLYDYHLSDLIYKNTLK